MMIKKYSAAKKYPAVFMMRAVLRFNQLFRKLFQKVAPPSLAIIEMGIGNYYMAQAIMVAAELGIADHLANGSKTADELAREVSADPRTLYRLLRALAMIGVFSQDKNERFKLTTISNYLRTDIPGSARPLLLMNNTGWHHQTWNNLLYTVKTGKPSFEYYFQKPFFKYLEENKQASEDFNRGMLGYSTQVAEAVVAAYNFSGFQKVVDVGGGYGTLTVPLLQNNSKLKGVLFDLPQVVKNAQDRIEAAGLTDRCELVGGSFFDAVPGEGDAYILMNVLHDWGDEEAIEILKCCRQCMPRHAKLLIAEQLLPADPSYHIGKFIDLEMAVFFPSGRERTQSEFRDLLQKAGFQLVRVVSTQSFSYVLESIKMMQDRIP